MRRLRLFLPHLRLPFQLTLAPIFLWGALLSGGALDWPLLSAFLSLHLFLYPAATAFNSAYDRDEGPIGGMEKPPPVPEGLLGFSLALGAAGILFALPAGGAFLLCYALACGWTLAYSHPKTRWKAGPVSSTLAIALGQGAIGFAAGWAAAAPLAWKDPVFAAGAASAALTAIGLYPLTQVFQVEEDLGRGDRTLAVVLGPERALRLGSAWLLAAGGIAWWVTARRFGLAEAAAIACGYLLLIGWQERISRTLERPNLYRRAMRLLNAGTTGFLLFLAWQAFQLLAAPIL
jgi:1,4-dihydroxy-2-naphthoate octaprenyltransferase